MAEELGPLGYPTSPSVPVPALDQRTLLWHLGYKEGQAYMVDSYCIFRQRSNNNSILNGHIEPLTQGHSIFLTLNMA